MLQKIYQGLPDNKDIYLWIWEALLTPISERSEFNYMSKPILNIPYYILIFTFYLIPIIYILKRIAHKFSCHNLYLVLSIFPFVFLFFIARDWGRWMHIIFMIIFCFYGLLPNKKCDDINLKNKFTVVVIFFLLIQIFATRLPHCCNLVEKKINLFGGFVSKVIVLNGLITNKIKVHERFKKI
jgi:hypothetical protein